MKKNKLEKIIDPKTMASFSDKINKDNKLNLTMNGVSEYFKEIASHFKKDKWPLSLSSIRSDLFFRITGLDDLSFIVSELAKHGVNVGYGTKDFGSVLYVEEKKKPTKKKPAKKKAKGKKK